MVARYSITLSFMRREALGDLQVHGRTAVACLVGEVRRFDNQCVAFPVSNGIAEPKADSRWLVLRVHVDDAGVVNHFQNDENGIGGLHDLVVVVIGGGRHGDGGSVADETAGVVGLALIIAGDIAETPSSIACLRDEAEECGRQADRQPSRSAFDRRSAPVPSHCRRKGRYRRRPEW